MVKVRSPCAKRIDTNPNTCGRLLDSRHCICWPRRHYSCHGGRPWLKSAWRLPIERASMTNKYNIPYMYVCMCVYFVSQSNASTSGGRPSQAREWLIGAANSLNENTWRKSLLTLRLLLSMHIYIHIYAGIFTVIICICL